MQPHGQQWYEVLGVSPFAPEEEVRDAYLTLVKRWHPDRHQNDPAAAPVAEERLKRINAAYDESRCRGALHDLRSEAEPGAHPVWDEPSPEDFAVPFVRVGDSRAPWVRGTALGLAVMFGAIGLAGNRFVWSADRYRTRTPRPEQVRRPPPPPRTSKPAPARRGAPTRDELPLD